MVQQVLNDMQEPGYNVTATDWNRITQNANALNGRAKVYIPATGMTPVTTQTVVPSHEPDSNGEYRVSFPAAAGGRIVFPLPAFWDLQWLATDSIDILLDWEIVDSAVTGSFAWQVAPEIWRPGIPTEDDLPILGNPVVAEAGALTAVQRYRTALSIPFAGSNSISTILASTPGNYSRTIGGEWQTRLAPNDLIRIYVTKAAPGSGTNVSTSIKLLQARARIGTTVDAADATPNRIRNVTVSGATARAAPDNLTFDASSGSFTINWDAPLSPPAVGGYQVAENSATFPDPAAGTIQTDRTYAKTGVSTGTHTYDIRTIGSSPLYLANTTPVRVTVVVA